LTIYPSVKLYHCQTGLTNECSRLDVCQVVEAEVEGDELAEVFEGLPADVADGTVREAEVRDDR